MKTEPMTINCLGELIDLGIPRIMGILNLTPDSFYDGGRYGNEYEILKQTERMLMDGATFIDIGGYSSRPGASDVTEEEEMNRVLPVIELLLRNFPGILISIDTFRSQVAARGLDLGAAMINDISAGSLDSRMMEVVGAYPVPYVMMHMKGEPKRMQKLTDYEDLLADILSYFSEKINMARDAGIRDCILDPGFGFAKTTEQNYELLSQLEIFTHFDQPVLAGVSRKSMIYKVLEIEPEEALNASTALHMYALQKGASILRVHDVKEAVECVTLYQQLHADGGSR